MDKPVTKFMFWVGIVALWIAMMVNQVFTRMDIRELKQPCVEQNELR